MSAMRKLTDEQVHEIHAHICGSCANLDSALPDGLTENDLTQADLQEIDALMFICSDCGWWCDTDEMAENDEDEQICAECERDNA